MSVATIEMKGLGFIYNVDLYITYACEGNRLHPFISISSDSSEESVGSHAPRVILFGVIPAIIPVISEVPVVPALHQRWGQFQSSHLLGSLHTKLPHNL
ncbi:hypothetical protein Tco_0980998 [Tanacetum coccineum]